jgi:hypothetical protein
LRGRPLPWIRNGIQAGMAEPEFFAGFRDGGPAMGMTDNFGENQLATLLQSGAQRGSKESKRLAHGPRMDSPQRMRWSELKLARWIAERPLSFASAKELGFASLRTLGFAPPRERLGIVQALIHGSCELASLAAPEYSLTGCFSSLPR